MSILDCENLDTLCRSLERITGIKFKQYEEFLNSFDIYDFYDRHPNYSYPQDVFVFLMKNEFKAEVNHHKTCWFHTTRSKRNHNYSKGILPLNAVIDKIWEELFLLVKHKIQKDEWLSFRHSVETNLRHHNASIYNHIMKDSSHWGPYGFLAKDLTCFDKDFSTWHYLDGPEIVLDICNCAKEVFKIDLMKLYQESTLPCVVKFEYEDRNIKNIGYALFYLYTIIKGDKISRGENICFSTRGKVISPSCIKTVQFFDT